MWKYRAEDGAGARRARFHGSMIDRDLLGKGKDFYELPESFVIFITENDKYARGVPIYHIERRIEEHDNALFGDGMHILYVNGEYQDVETPVGRLMHDFYCMKSEDMYSKVLADEVKYLKETAERVAEEKAKDTARMPLTLNKLSHEEISRSTGLSIEVVEELATQKTA